MPIWTRPVAPEDQTLAFLGDSGIILGLEDGEGCRWRWQTNDPWSPSPAPRAVTGDRATGHGSWDATKHYGARVTSFTGIVEAPSHMALHAAKQRLFDAVSIDPFELRVVEPGFDRISTVRRDGEVLWTEMRSTVSATYSLSLYSPDPVIQGVVTKAVGGTGDIAQGWATHVAVNAGGIPVAPLITITGPSGPDVVLSNVRPGRERGLILQRTSGAPVLAAGETLEADMRRRTVTVDGVNVRGWMTGDWWTLEPGENELYLNPFGLGSPSGPVETTTWCRWRDGWI